MDQFYLDDTRRKLTDIPAGSVRQSIHRENDPRTFILPNRVFGGNEPAGNAEVYLLSLIHI